jgi:hypothetical protein
MENKPVRDIVRPYRHLPSGNYGFCSPQGLAHRPVINNKTSGNSKTGALKKVDFGVRMFPFLIPQAESQTFFGKYCSKIRSIYDTH